jgi:hypothetical protein
MKKIFQISSVGDRNETCTWWESPEDKTINTMEYKSTEVQSKEDRMWKGLTDFEKCIEVWLCWGKGGVHS